MTTDTHTRPGSSQSRAEQLRRSGLAGLAAPIVFWGVIILLTWLEYDFLHGLGLRLTADYPAQVPYPSSLARGDWGWLQIANFLALGALALVFLRGLRTQFVGRWSGRVATGALVTFGFAGLLNAIPTSLPGDETQWMGLLHFGGFLLTMLSALVASLATGLALRRNPDWRGWWLVPALTMPVLLAAFVGHTSVPGALDFWIVLVPLVGWFGVVGAHLWTLGSRAGRVADGPAKASGA